VAVRVIAPLCDQNPNPVFDLPYLAALKAGGVDARAMPAPPSASVPYMHAKMMIADGTSAYIGSVNFSTSSTTKSRELGIFFTDAPTIETLSETFEGDWSKAVKPPAASAAGCTATASDDG
jgi:cardiolipin synthase A/B